MLVNYTETLETLLKNKHYGEGNEDPSLTEILDLMFKFPNFEFLTDDDRDIEFRMIDLFIQKYDIREIGAETEEMFLHFWREKTNELLMKYAPKMQKWKENFDDLFKFTVKLERDETIADYDNNKNTYYLNPVSSATENLKVQDVDKSENTSGSSVHSERDVLQSVWGKTRADIMEKILNLKDIFNDCLSEYETIFMGVF